MYYVQALIARGQGVEYLFYFRPREGAKGRIDFHYALHRGKFKKKYKRLFSGGKGLLQNTEYFITNIHKL